MTFNQANDKMKGFEGDMLFLGLNPAPGATLAYRLKADAKDVSWIIRDGTAQVREMTGDAMRDRNTAGLNIVKWDLRVQPLRPLPPPPGGAPAGGGGGGGGFGGAGNNGPFVLPGTYRATLRVDGKDVQTMNVDGEGRSRDHDHRRRSTHVVRRGQGSPRAAGAGQRRRRDRAERQRADDAAHAADAQRHHSGGRQEVDGSLSTELQRLRTRLGLGGQAGGGGGFGGGAENVRGRVGQLRGAIQGSTSVPTTTQMAQMRELRSALPKVIDDAEAAGKRMPGLVRDLLSAGVIFTPAK